MKIQFKKCDTIEINVQLWSPLDNMKPVIEDFNVMQETVVLRDCAGSCLGMATVVNGFGVGLGSSVCKMNLMNNICHEFFMYIV